jgi:outer membrane protein OmpA-like peptidoglycan-associated protein
MKKGNVLFYALLILVSSVAMGAKKPPKNNKSAVGNSKWSIGLGMEVADFYSPKLDKLSTFKKPIWFGPRLTMWRNFNSSVALGLDLGSYAFSSKLDDATLPPVNTYNLLYSGLAAYKFNNGYILKEDAAVAPYLFVKLQGTWAKSPVSHDNVNGFGIPIGAGINFKIANNVAFNVNGGYNFGIKNNEDHIFFGAGLMLDLGKGKEVAAPVDTVVATPVDTDGDGIYDIDDACPEVPGLAQFNGCPDTDGDGVEDSKDECPTVAGLAEFNGCPDTDGDGIIDAKDACPEVKGVAKFGGCPDPDRDGDGIVNDKDLCPDVAGAFSAQGCPDKDGDGVADAQDKCPDVAGPASNKGCPELKEEVKKKLAFAAKNIMFETGKAVIKPSSYKILDEVASILNEFSYYDVNIDGHTDNVGDDAFNLKLSQERAAAAMAYLTKKGVSASRMVATGYGETKPQADNKTAAGRAANRRVEFNLIFK